MFGEYWTGALRCTFNEQLCREPVGPRCSVYVECKKIIAHFFNLKFVNSCKVGTLLSLVVYLKCRWGRSSSKLLFTFLVSGQNENH